MPKPGSAPAGGAIEKLVPSPTRASVAAQVSTGTAGITSCATVTLSTALPSADFAETVQLSLPACGGAVRFQLTGAAPPAGISTVSGLPWATAGVSTTFAVTRIGLSEPLRSVNIAPNVSPVRTTCGTPG